MRATALKSMGVVLGVAMLMLYQNCANNSVSQSGASAPAASSATSLADSGGVPYDGKVYVARGETCPDGSEVRSRIVVGSSQQAYLTRENCSEITPVSLAQSDYSFDALGAIAYHSLTFIPQEEALTVKPLASWYFQLQGTVVEKSASVHDIDMFNTPAQTIQNLKTSGHTVICYISVGSLEDYRPDASSFLPGDVGNLLGGGASSDRWLDTRSSNVRSLMLARLDLARSKGCHGVDLDNVDAFYHNSGFALSEATAIEYLEFLARAAHDRGLLVALNSVGDLSARLADLFDFAIAQECMASGECTKFQPFIDRDKGVLIAEYTPYSAQTCATAKAASISLAFFNRNLDGTVFTPCP